MEEGNVYKQWNGDGNWNSVVFCGNNNIYSFSGYKKE